MKKPNILWICADHLRFDALGCYGNSHVHTPNIDQLAKNGCLFSNAYCQSPVCTPSRASFLTGRYPRTTRCRQNGQPLSDDEIVITQTLRKEGYTSGFSGKLHLHTCTPDHCKNKEERIEEYYDIAYWSHNPWRDYPDDNNQYRKWLRDQGVVYDTPPFEGSKYVERGMPSEYHQTKWCADRAIDFVQEMSKYEKPWLFSVNLYDPHHPFDPPEEHLRPFLERLDEIPLPDYVEGELNNKPSFQHFPIEVKYHFKEMSERDHRLVRSAYWAMVDNIDVQVGRIMQALERMGQIENTIVIFTSDHGEMLGDHGIYLKGPYFYEPAVKVPLIVSIPWRINEAMRSEALVELIDLVPTIYEEAGIDQDPWVQGRSLSGLLKGVTDTSIHRDSVYCEYYKALVGHEDPPAYATMVRDERYKVVCVHGLDEGELYDLEEDPGEIRNLWGNSDYRETKIGMLKLMCDRMAWTMDPLPERQSWKGFRAHQR